MNYVKIAIKRILQLLYTLVCQGLFVYNYCVLILCDALSIIYILN